MTEFIETNNEITVISRFNFMGICIKYVLYSANKNQDLNNMSLFAVKNGKWVSI